MNRFLRLSSSSFFLSSSFLSLFFAASIIVVIKSFTITFVLVTISTTNAHHRRGPAESNKIRDCDYYNCDCAREGSNQLIINLFSLAITTAALITDCKISAQQTVASLGLLLVWFPGRSFLLRTPRSFPLRRILFVVIPPLVLSLYRRKTRNDLGEAPCTPFGRISEYLAILVCLCVLRFRSACHDRDSLFSSFVFSSPPIFLYYFCFLFVSSILKDPFVGVRCPYILKQISFLISRSHHIFDFILHPSVFVLVPPFIASPSSLYLQNPSR